MPGRAADAAGKQVALVGHSMSVDAATEIAVCCPPQCRVAVVLNYYEHIDIYDRFFGRGVVSAAEGFKGWIMRVERDELRPVIERDPEIHAAIIAELANLPRLRVASSSVRRKHQPAAPAWRVFRIHHRG